MDFFFSTGANRGIARIDGFWAVLSVIQKFR